jgi:hypothetical protein
MNSQYLSLKKIALKTRSKEDFGFLFRNFLDEFYAKPDPSRLSARPPLLADRLKNRKNGEEMDSYLGALAHYLSALYGFKPPAWCFARTRYLKRPWFAMQTPAARLFLITESPGPFRERNCSSVAMRLREHNLSEISPTSALSAGL